MTQRALLATGLVLVALVAYLLGEPYGLVVQLPPLPSFAVQARVLLVVAGVAAALLSGRDIARWRHAGDQERQRASRWTVAWRSVALGWGAGLVPALLVLGVFLVAGAWPEGVPVATALVVLAVTLPLALVAQAGDTHVPIPWLQRVVGRLVVLAAALTTFTGLLAVRPPVHLAVPAAGMVSGLLAAALWRPAVARTEKTSLQWALPAAVMGLIMAEIAWPLLFWPATALMGGLICLGVFYGATGVLGGLIRNDRPVREMLEYAAVGVAAVVVVIFALVSGP